MASVISQTSSRNPGADLWVLPDLASCRHTIPLDWELNFQITKASRHESPKPPQQIQDILSETGLEPSPVVSQIRSSLLLPTQHLLPNRWVLVLTYTSMEAWVKDLHQAWKGLQEPTLRVFLPSGQNAGSFQKIWQTYSSNEDYSLVLD